VRGTLTRGGEEHRIRFTEKEPSGCSGDREIIATETPHT